MNAANSSGIIVGSHNASEPYERNVCGYYYNGNGWQLEYGSYYPVYASPVELNKIHEIKCSTIIGDAYFELNGTRILSSTATTSVSRDNVWIFKARYNDAYNIPTTNAKLYYAKIYDSSKVLVRDFVPCYRKSDGEIGLYDRVENKFYTNAGTGVFLKGNDVN